MTHPSARARALTPSRAVIGAHDYDPTTYETDVGPDEERREVLQGHRPCVHRPKVFARIHSVRSHMHHLLVPISVLFYPYDMPFPVCEQLTRT